MARRRRKSRKGRPPCKKVYVRTAKGRVVGGCQTTKPRRRRRRKSHK
jgi:hypothetical protein